MEEEEQSWQGWVKQSSLGDLGWGAGWGECPSLCLSPYFMPSLLVRAHLHVFIGPSQGGGGIHILHKRKEAQRWSGLLESLVRTANPGLSNSETMFSLMCWPSRTLWKLPPPLCPHHRLCSQVPLFPFRGCISKTTIAMRPQAGSFSPGFACVDSMPSTFLGERLEPRPAKISAY